MKINKVNMISVQEWDKLVTKTYKRPYSFQQQDGCKDRGVFDLTVPCESEDFENDAVPEIVNHNERGVSFKAWLERNPQKILRDDEPSSFSQLIAYIDKVKLETYRLGVQDENKRRID